MIVVGLVALFFYIYKRMQRRSTGNIAHQAPQLLPWEIAYENLERLKNENLLARGLIKEYYIRLSDIVRHYLEGRFQLRAPEMTTEEFLHSLQYSTELNAQHKESLKNFLNACDMVKFAKYDPDVRESEQSFLFAKKLVDETKPIALGT